MLKKIALIITLIYTIALAIISLIRLNNLPDIGVSFGDKIFHFLAYGLLTFLWYQAFLQSFKFKIKRAIYSAVILSVIFGIIIEVLQGTITVVRAMDVYDAVANTLGALLVSIFLCFKNSLHIKNS
ncbi:VanZ family protein [Litoribaculum gwangyangense]|uniref:VanZ-like domain-containing protein n=1 Tax=Litoribaculum gwangyangense TaxID=1130722 RepID=A0ABP9BTM9_9FLAO